MTVQNYRLQCAPKACHPLQHCLPLVFFILLLPVVMAHAEHSQPRNLHDVYLANTEHELHVFRIFGKHPGKTLMLIGGIQGDEPGGYLTADLYADIDLKKGNLIVVPRANFYSILLNQRNGLTGDMNRKFGKDTEPEKNLEQEIVTILKELIGQADCLLNLHEGSGFYHPEWRSDNENPNRFGQSIIYDAASYTPAGKATIELQALASKVVDRVNLQIENPRHHFRINNHDTVDDGTQHPEQRKSATFYALTRAGIPAFGVETSKSIQNNAEKVNLQKQVVNAFMAEFGVEPDTPGLHVEETQVAYILVQVNGNHPYAVATGSELQLAPGDEVIVTDIIANKARGLTVDFVGMGSHNDTRLPFRIAGDTTILVRKDAQTCGQVALTTSPATTEGTVQKDQETKSVLPEGQEPSLAELKAEKLIILVDGELQVIAEGEELVVARDKLIILKAVHSNIARLDTKIIANLKGFAPPKLANDGNDLNFPVYPKEDLWVRYSEDKKGIRYPIHTSMEGQVIGEFWLKLAN